MSKTRYLVIVADDFGVSEGVNRAVVESHCAGTLTSASLAPTGAAAEDAVERARLTPTLHVGLHLVLAVGRPLCSPADIPSLVDDDGCFVPRSKLFRRAVTGRLALREVEVEAAAQVTWLQERGVDLRFINGDQHVQVLPVIRDVVVGLARKLRVPVRVPAERSVFVGRALSPRGLGRLGSKAVLRLMARSLGRQADTLGEPSGMFLSPFGVFPRPRFDLETFVQLLELVRPGVNQLMVHPAYPDPALAAFWHVPIDDLRDRKCELDVLIDPRFLLALEERGIVMMGYPRVGAA